MILHLDDYGRFLVKELEAQGKSLSWIVRNREEEKELYKKFIINLKKENPKEYQKWLEEQKKKAK